MRVTWHVCYYCIVHTHKFLAYRHLPHLSLAFLLFGRETSQMALGEHFALYHVWGSLWTALCLGPKLLLPPGHQSHLQVSHTHTLLPPKPPPHQPVKTQCNNSNALQLENRRITDTPITPYSVHHESGQAKTRLAQLLATGLKCGSFSSRAERSC